jgi:hypothetical protein
MTASGQSSDLRGVSGDCRAFCRKYTGNPPQISLGSHANFVINFCQILFAVETA